MSTLATKRMSHLEKLATKEAEKAALTKQQTEEKQVDTKLATKKK